MWEEIKSDQTMVGQAGSEEQVFRSLLLPLGNTKEADLCHGEAGRTRHVAKAVSGTVPLETPDVSPLSVSQGAGGPLILALRANAWRPLCLLAKVPAGRSRTPTTGREQTHSLGQTASGHLPLSHRCVSDNSFRHNTERAQAKQTLSLHG